MKLSDFKGIRFLGFVLLLYLLLFFITPDKTVAALHKSGAILGKLLPIFLVVILLTGIIQYFLNPKQIVKYFGKESGLKGWLYAMLGGVISHGPMYAWYPMLQEMRHQGVRDGLVAAFFYARAIKLPLLPLMIDYFGLTFSIFLSLYILAGAVVQGRVIEWCQCAEGESDGD